MPDYLPARTNHSRISEEGIVIRSATMLTLAFLLSALPVSIGSDENGTFGGVQVLAEPGGNGKGNGNGGGNSNGNAGGNSAANSHGAKGLATAAKSATSKDKTQLAKNDPLHPHNLGRLNSFFNASSLALKNASAQSAVGLISQVYAGQVAAYVAALADATTTTALDPAATTELQAAAATLAKVANKPLSAEIITAIHERLAQEDPALAGLASPTPDEIAADSTGTAAAAAVANATLVENLLAAATAADGQITNNGLGQIY